MIPYLQDPDVTLWHGDVLAVLRELPDESVDCAATSPPFFGLRDYQTGRWEGGDEGCEHRHDGTGSSTASSRLRLDGRTHVGPYEGEKDTRKPYRDTCGKCGARRIDQQIGLESSPEEWRDRLVEVFREVRRVLVPSGTCWIECGDSYNSAASNDWTKWDSRNLETAGTHPRQKLIGGMKPKDLIGSPFLLAFGLRDDGWWWRSTNIWHKPNCLPESVTDRPVVSHSYVFQFSKKARYFHDAEAVREPAEWARWGDQTVRKDHPAESGAGWIKPHSKEYLAQGRTTNGPRSTENREQTPGFEQRLVAADGTKSLRSVWQIPTQGFPEAHFATWPTKLAERILLMACPEQVCRVCGKARERVVESGELVGRTANDGRGYVLPKAQEATGHKPTETYRPNAHYERQTLGFTDCGHSDDYRPGIVLDPFAGSGTTMWVARKLGRRSVGIDLNSGYLDLAARRLQQQSLFAVTD